jgi:Cupredoxin-like domain
VYARPEFVPDREENEVKAVRTILLPTGLVMTLSAIPVRAAEPANLQLVIRDHRFEPAELRVPANTPLVIEVRNEDDTAEEFESADLKVEKVIAGKRHGTVRLRALPPGRYPFIGEYHADTAKGVLVAE